MISVGYAHKSTVYLLLQNNFHFRVLGNGSHVSLLKDYCKHYGSSPFQEANQQTSTGATSTEESVSQTLKCYENYRKSSQSSQPRNDTNHSLPSYKLSKPKKYFDVDINPGGSNMPPKKQLPSENNTSKNKNPKPRRATVHQLLHLAKHGHIQQAEKIFQQLEASGKFQPGTGLLVSLLGMYLAAEQLPPAQATLSRLHALHPHAALSAPTILAFATLMMHHGLTNECIKLLADEAALTASAADNSATATDDEESVPEAAGTPVLPGKDGKPQKPVCSTVYSDKLCHTLLMVPAARGDVSATEAVLEALLCHHYTKPSRAILGPLVQARIISRDWDGALATLQRLAQEHDCLPCRPELMKALVRLKDTPRLQKVVELSAELLGRENALLDLAVCFLESDDTDKAIALLQEMQSTLSAGRLQYLCQYYARHRNTHSLRNLLSVVRTCGSAQDVQLVCAHIIRVYDETHESSLATELLQAEGLTRQKLPPVSDHQPPGGKQTSVTTKNKTRDAASRS